MIANHEIERAVLAVMVAHNDASVLKLLDKAHFDAQTNRAIFEALEELHEAGRKFDEPTLVAHLTNVGTLSQAGGKAGVGALYYHDTALRANMPDYIADLRNALARRQLAKTLAKLAQHVEQAPDSVDVIAEHVESNVLELTRRTGGEGHYIGAARMATDALDLIEEARKRGDGLVGLPTGLKPLDDLLGGWEPGTVTVIMGTPGVGKTALWLQSAMHVAARAPIAMVQLEMTPAKMGLRALSNSAQVSFRRIRRGSGLSDRDWQRLADATGRVAEREVMIAPPGIHEWGDIKAWFRRMHIDHGAASLWLDNIKIVGMKGVKDLDRLQVITREMKLLSRELNVPVIAIHHMHRLEEGKRPSLTSGYGSSSIEQDADNVLALWRPNERLADEVEVLPLKTRDDFAKATTLLWHGDQQRYSTIEPSEPITPPVAYAN